MTLSALIDAHMLASQETGNETYTENLLLAISKLDIRCGASVLPTYTPDKRFANIDFLPLKPSGNWARLLFSLPKICRDWKADILHSTYISPFFSPCPFVTSVHDISFKDYPQFFSPRDRLLFATLLPLTMRRAQAIITISQHAKKEITKTYPYLQNKVHVTLLAASPTFRIISNPEMLQGVQDKHNLRSRYILAVGNLQPRKNLRRLIRAFATVHQQDPSIMLVIVGKAQWKSSSIYEDVRNLMLEDHIVFTGYIPDAQKYMVML